MMDVRIFGIIVCYVILKFGIDIKFVVCMEDEVHMWFVFIVVFHFIKKDVVMTKYTK